MATKKSPLERFWKRVNVIEDDDSCWEWQGACSPKGYGNFGLGNRKWMSTHRFSYSIHYGPIPAGKMVCHTCDNPKCVRPKHLFLSNAQGNADDKVTKGRAAIKLTEQQVLSIRVASGTQQEIADQFGIDQTMVSLIKRKKSWGHL